MVSLKMAWIGFDTETKSDVCATSPGLPCIIWVSGSMPTENSPAFATCPRRHRNLRFRQSLLSRAGQSE